MMLLVFEYKSKRNIKKKERNGTICKTSNVFFVACLLFFNKIPYCSVFECYFFFIRISE